MIWDKGTYRTEGPDSAEAQLKRGEITFKLEGKRLHGSFVLVRLNQKPQNAKRAKPWLLIEYRDRFAAESWNIDQHLKSAASGCDMDEIGRAPT